MFEGISLSVPQARTASTVGETRPKKCFHMDPGPNKIPKTTATNPTIKVLFLWGERPPSWSLWYLSRLSVSLSFRNLGWQRWVGSVAGETRAYMGQTETCPKVCPITMNSDETKWDRISPMSRTFLGGSGGRRGPHWVIWGVGGPCML